MVGKRVFLLGAGASVDAGGPIMQNWPEALCNVNVDLVPEETVSDEMPSRDLISLMQEYIRRELIKKTQWNIEDLLSYTFTLEQINQPIKIGSPPIPVKPRTFRMGFIWLLKKSLEELLMKPIPRYYLDFANDLDMNFDTIITLNYDLVIEDALQQVGKCYYYFLNKFNNSMISNYHSDPGIGLLKLHGSLNWQMCMGEARGYPKIKSLADCRIIHLFKEKQISLDPFQDDECPSCNRSMRETLIVPPIFGKAEHVRVLSSVWTEAAFRLAMADEIICIGYSLPIADKMIEFLLTSIHREALSQRIKVATKKEDVLRRYKKLPFDHVEQLPIHFREYVELYQ